MLRFWAFTIFLLLSSSLFLSSASERQEAVVDEDGNVVREMDDRVIRLLALAEISNLDVPVEEAIEIVELIKAARSDTDTQAMIQKMKVEQSDLIQGMIDHDGDNHKDALMGLRNAFSEMKMLERLFENPAKALEVMNEEGMVPPERLPEYKRDPRLLEADTRKGLYFVFVLHSTVVGLL